MHGDEEVGVRGTGTRDAIAKLDELIAIAGQHGVHAGLRVEALGECPRDGERDVLLARSPVAYGARVHPAVAGIDRDDHVPIAIARGVHGADGFRARDRREGDCRLTERHGELPPERPVLQPLRTGSGLRSSITIRSVPCG